MAVVFTFHLPNMSRATVLFDRTTIHTTSLLPTPDRHKWNVNITNVAPKLPTQYAGPTGKRPCVPSVPGPLLCTDEPCVPQCPLWPTVSYCVSHCALLYPTVSHYSLLCPTIPYYVALCPTVFHCALLCPTVRTMSHCAHYVPLCALCPTVPTMS